MSHADAISEAIVTINGIEMDPVSRAKAVKALTEARKFLRKNTSALRDSFAKAAITGAVFEYPHAQEPAQVAQFAYAIADAMMGERVKDRHRRNDDDQEEA